MSKEYHIQQFQPILPHWPAGGWSLYNISGDAIAQRIKFDSKGKIEMRHSWCGYIGCYETLPELMAAIETNQQESKS